MSQTVTCAVVAACVEQSPHKPERKRLTDLQVPISAVLDTGQKDVAI
jgi:hypothetical protein